MNTTNTLNGKIHQPNTPRKTRTARAAEETIKPASDQEKAKMNALNKFLQAQEDMLREWGAPSGKRAMVAFATTLIVACGVGFLGGLIIETLVMVTLTLTGSALLAFLVWALGVAAMVVGGSVVATNTYAYIISRKADMHIDQVKGWFKTVTAQANALMQRGDKPEGMVH